MEINLTLIDLVRRRNELNDVISELVRESFKMDDLSILKDNSKSFANYIKIGMEIDKLVGSNTKLDDLYNSMVIAEDSEDYENAIYYRDQIISFT